jgi:short-subunit dehydrogenase
MNTASKGRYLAFNLILPPQGALVMQRKRAFVTGASEGIGRAFVKRLARDGFDTTSVARNEFRLKELMNELAEEEDPGRHDYLIADLCSDEGVERCTKRLSESHYDLLVNNAGYSNFGDFAEAHVEDQQKIMRVDVLAVITLAHAFLQKARPGDAMINLSSITHYLPTPIQPVYVASKSFVASLSESLWYQQRKKDVYVQGLCAGLTKTQFIERARHGEGIALLDWISHTPERVVDISIAELAKRRKPIVIPGLRNRLLVFFLSFVPRKALVYLSGKLNDLA